MNLDWKVDWVKYGDQIQGLRGKPKEFGLHIGNNGEPRQAFEKRSSRKENKKIDVGTSCVAGGLTV